MENTEKKGIFTRIYLWFKNLTVKGLLGVILVAFIIIILFMSASYLPKMISKVSSALTAALYSVFIPAEEASLTSDKIIINSGEDFTVSFKKGELNVDGIFAISYNCDTNLNLVALEASGLKDIPCSKPYYLLNNDNSLRIRATTINESVVRLAIDGTFENNEEQKIEKIGVIRMTVKNNSVGPIVNDDNNYQNGTDTTTPPNTPTYNPPVTTTPPPTYTPPYVPPTITPVYYGQPDLAIRLLQTGRLIGNNQIIAQSSFAYNDMVGIRFEIRNDGDANTGIWYFTASLPSNSTPVYNSPAQISLRPGESIQFTLGFTGLVNQYSNLITVRADSLNQVIESNESNNVLTSSVINTGYNNNNFNNNYNNYGNYSNCYVNGVYDYNYCNNYYNNNNGCYINGIFTYNCNNNYNNNYGTLGVRCYAEPSNPEEGDRVRWYADAFGGDGDYDYDWDGTNNLNSSSKNPSKTYNSDGWKYATVTVRSAGTSVSSTCSVYVDND